MSEDDIQTKTEVFLRSLAENIDNLLEEATGERLGFALLVFRMEEKAETCNYISNVERADMIKVLEIGKKRLETNKDIKITPPTIQ